MFTMKSFFAVMLLCVALSVWGAESAPKTAANATEARKTIVYYFHGTARCPTCMKLEAYTRETVAEMFGDLLKNGQVEWRVVNTDEAANVHFVKDYLLDGKSVVLVEFQGGQQIRWKNLEKIWDLVANKDEFKKYIGEELVAYVNAK